MLQEMMQDYPVMNVNFLSAFSSHNDRSHLSVFLSIPLCSISPPVRYGFGRYHPYASLVLVNGEECFALRPVVSSDISVISESCSKPGVSTRVRLPRD